MGKNTKKKKKKNTQQPSKPSGPPKNAGPSASSPSAEEGIGSLPFVGGIFLLLVALGASSALVLESFDVMSLPGCGEGSGCARASASVWGKIPLLGWPLSSVGAAYFLALLITFLTGRGRLPTALHFLVRFSVIGSVVLVTVMFKNGYVCKYCLIVHGANLLLWLLVEFLPVTKTHAMRSLGILAGCFAVGLGGLLLAERVERSAIREQAEKDRSESVQEILQAPAEQRFAFTGRYHYGPKDAPIHIVMFTDYQCPDCQYIERQVERIFQERNDVSLSIKHFPFCSDCNPNIKNSLHPDACNAARIAETAGILRGDEGYYEMHFWLFGNLSRMKVLNDSEVTPALQSMGYDVDAFKARMFQPDVTERILADSAEAISLGLYFTPMIFINGVQLRYVKTPDILYKTVNELAAQQPRPAFDVVPPPAREKYLEDWRVVPAWGLPRDLDRRALGPDSARVRIVVWGDYLEPKTGELDAIARRFVSEHPDVQYTFRHYPLDLACNPNLRVTTNALACRAHHAVAAAGLIGGDEAYWALHRLVFDNQAQFDDDWLRSVAPNIGLDPDELLAMMDAPEAQTPIEEDIQAGKSMRFRGVPSVYVNEKQIPRPWFEEDCLLDDVCAELLGEAPAAPASN